MRSSLREGEGEVKGERAEIIYDGVLVDEGGEDEWSRQGRGG